MSVDRYAKFISEQARIARLDETKGLTIKHIGNTLHGVEDEKSGFGPEFKSYHFQITHPDGVVEYASHCPYDDPKTVNEWGKEPPIKNKKNNEDGGVPEEDTFTAVEQLNKEDFDDDEEFKDSMKTVKAHYGIKS